MAPSDVESVPYGSFHSETPCDVGALLCGTSRPADAPAQAPSGWARASALSLGKIALGVVIGVVAARGGSRGDGAPAGVALARASADAAAARAAGADAAAGGLEPVGVGVAESLAGRTTPRATQFMQKYGRLERKEGDNNRWTDEEAAAWTCCASVDASTGGIVNSPPFAQPAKIYSSGGVLETTLTVESGRFEGPISFNVRSYEGGMPGPTLYAKRGDTLMINLKNGLEFPTTEIPKADDAKHEMKLAVQNILGQCLPYGEPNVTSLHVHGLHTNVDGKGDYPLKLAHPHETVPYELHIREDHPTGTFWYHPHSKDGAALQVTGMMAGALIVEDDASAWSDISADLSDITDRVMMFQWVDFLHDFDNYTHMAKCSGSNMHAEFQKHTDGTSGYRFVTINGQYLPEIDIGGGEWQRWRFVNAISHAFLNISIVDKRGDSACEMYEIAADGVYYGSPRQSSHVFVTLGGRKDVLIKCPDSGWFTMYSTQAADSVVDFSDPNEFGGSLGNVRVYASDDDRSSVNVAAISLPGTGLYDRSFIDSHVDVEYSLILSDYKDTPTEWFTMNGVVYNSLIGHRIALNSLQEWDIKHKFETSDSDETNHNWHLHTHHFQIAYTSDPRGHTTDYQIGDWRDTINVPLGGSIKVRFKAENYAGYLLHHCHVFNHETAGLKQLVSVVNCSDDRIYNELKKYADSFGMDITICSDADDDDSTKETALSHSGFSPESTLGTVGANASASAAAL